MLRHTRSRGLARLVIATGLVMSACISGPLEPGEDPGILVAKGGGKPAPTPGTGPTSVTVLDLGIRSDGRGAYSDGVCGVTTTIFDLDGTGNLWERLILNDGSTLPSSCGEPRAAAVRMLVRHISDNPHVDDATTPVGDVLISNMWFGANGAAKINAPGPACFYSSRGGRSWSGVGMRFNSAVYPGSDDLNVTVISDRQWHIETAPYPDNVAYCDGDLGTTFWHIDLSLDVNPAP